MPDIQTSTTSDEGFATTSQVGDYAIDIDATNERGPNPNATLVATYASCFLPAFRVGGRKTGHDELGKIQIDADAELTEGDDLSEIRFDVYVEADLSDEEFAEITALAEDICHVHDALRDDLQASVTVVGNAF